MRYKFWYWRVGNEILLLGTCQVQEYSCTWLIGINDMKKSNGYLRQDRSRSNKTKHKGKPQKSEPSKQDDAKTHAGRRTSGRVNINPDDEE